MNIDDAMVAAQEKLSSTDESIPEPVEAPAEASPESTEHPAPDAAPQPAPSQERARDEGGRFTKEQQKQAAKKTAAAPKGGANGAVSAAPPAVQGQPAGTTPAVPAGPPVPAVKAPQSWTPAEREFYAKASPELQKVIDRRERDYARGIQESSEARKTAETVQRTLAPYETIARANGMDAMSYAGSVLQTAAALHLGAPQQKAAVVANIIRSYGVDIDALSAALQGQPQAQQPAQQYQQPQDIQAMVQQTLARERALQDAEAFLATEPKYIDIVQKDMIALMQAKRSQGGNMTWQQAYDAACKLNDEVQEDLAREKAAEAVRTAQPVTDEQRRAASSPRTQPASRPSAPVKGLDAAMNAARKKLNL